METANDNAISPTVSVTLTRQEWLIVATIVADTAKYIKDVPTRVRLKELGLRIVHQAKR